MFWKITGKLLLKALLPLLILIGILNYTASMRGGDPFAMWRSVGGNMVSSVKNSTAGLLSSADGVKSDIQNIGTDGSSTQIYSWKDSKGMMHYSTTKPDGIITASQSYDPDANVVKRFIAPVKPKKEEKPEQAEAPASSSKAMTLSEGAEKLPDIEGLDLKELDEILKARQEMLDKY